MYYLRDLFEVDFFIPGSLLLQASYSMESQDTRDREINALMKANKKLEADTLLIITFDREETLEVNNTKIRVIPAWKWMLRTA